MLTLAVEMQFSRRAQMDAKEIRTSGSYIRKAMVLALAASALFPVTQAQAANSLFELFQQRRQQAEQPVAPLPPAAVAPRAAAAAAPKAPTRIAPPAKSMITSRKR
jgi:hypothetical protein